MENLGKVDVKWTWTSKFLLERNYWRSSIGERSTYDIINPDQMLGNFEEGGQENLVLPTIGEKASYEDRIECAYLQVFILPHFPVCTIITNTTFTT